MNQRDNKVLHIGMGLLAFSCGYLLLNYTQFLYKIYYRYAAAHDAHNAFYNFIGFFIQGNLLLIACIFLPRKSLVLVLIFISFSSLVHLSYEQILGGYIDSDVMSWLLSEARQATNAMSEFLPKIGIAIAKVCAIVCLFIFSRKLIRPRATAQHPFLEPSRHTSGLVALGSALTFMVVPGEMLRLANAPQGNETSAYTLASRVFLSAEPQRIAVEGSPLVGKQLAKKIVWLIDESISAQGFAMALAGSVDIHRPIDFGEVASMGNCSASSNAALRWGVNVTLVDTHTDLRKAPTIWAYAKQAGYQTTLIDGQVSGAPQNMVWKPERALIDDFIPAKGGIDADHVIAEKVNIMLKRPGSDFIYVVLRGAHYAYESNYPKNFLTNDGTIFQKYLGAIKYSKKGFFDALFLDVDRNQVAAIYTSDHGQHIEEGKVPHCTLKPSADEYSVPLLAFLPEQAKGQLKVEMDTTALAGRSHSQIFPTSLWLMGYEKQYAEDNFDALLNKPTNRYVWFGRTFTPNSDTGLIELHTSDKFPMR
jgi:glucan phosphoethanolaminetransferase (alkaline phosphatase superfamily)